LSFFISLGAGSAYAGFRSKRPRLAALEPGRVSGQPLGARKGLKRKAHRICIGKSEDLARKARFFAVCEFAEQIHKPQKMRPNLLLKNKCGNPAFPAYDIDIFLNSGYIFF
jgi:hypothetical protein